MTFDLGYFLLGALLIAVAVLGSFVKRLPFTTTMIYLAARVIIGPLGFGFSRQTCFIKSSIVSIGTKCPPCERQNSSNLPPVSSPL